jgi:hypothetical protein
MKKIITLIISMAMLFAITGGSLSISAATTTAPEEEELTYGGHTYIVNDDGTATITGSSGTGTENINTMSIPATIAGLVVTGIGDEAFYGTRSLVKLTLPGSLKTIGMGSFAGCYGLKILELPDKLESIGDGAFASCVGLTEIKIPDSVTEVGAYAFTGCTAVTSVTLSKGMDVILDNCFDGLLALKSIEIPSNIVYISHGAFGNSGLETFTIPKSVNSIGSYVFRNCDSLTQLNAEEGNGAAKSVDGVLYSLDGKTLVQYPAGRADTNFAFPDTIETIGNSSFYGADNITTLDFPDNVTTIEDAAFMYCKNLTEINWNSAITKISTGCFSYCTSLSTLTIPDTINSIDDYAFFFCEKLKSVSVPSSVGHIGKQAIGFYEVVDENTGESEFTQLEGVNIFAEEGSAAETYAKENNVMLNYNKTGISNTDIILLVLGSLLVVIAVVLSVYILKRAFKAKKEHEVTEQAPSVLGSDPD